MIDDERKKIYFRALARSDCQRTGCSRPAVYAVVFDYPCEEENKRHHLGSSLGSCEECRPYFLEKILPELVRDLQARGLGDDLQFELIKIEE